MYAETNTSAAEAMAYLASMMACLTGVAPTTILNGGALRTSITVRCPVTDKSVTFEDFDAIAFCPQAAFESDPLYDPLMAAPHACVNVSSDMFGFAIFVRDLSMRQFGVPPFQLVSRLDRTRLFEQTGTYWQRFAEGTIRRYQQLTNTSLCPVHLTPDRRHWVANHKDPAFAELEKSAHLHDMPAVYTTGMIKAWERYFEDGIEFDMSDLGSEGRLI